MRSERRLEQYHMLDLGYILCIFYVYFGLLEGAVSQNFKEWNIYMYFKKLNTMKG